ncbi:hypothetical protein ELQ92_11740 [Labedella populi]|uniref:Uncharacterized protein n=1 Tax=Labedella populi TaxID=2498850 RepID=A0A444Q6H0_9MICO|nr:hypothetical protein [Labedella populi]RWZ59505.1 hypothetical protein ELQ92_11740 [Labedella populi]
MKHVTYAQKSLLMGDDMADALLAYAALLADAGSADSVQVKSLGIDGEEVVATFVLGNGIDLMAETTRSQLPEPDNSATLQYIRDRSEAVNNVETHVPVAATPSDFGDLDDA